MQPLVECTGVEEGGSVTTYFIIIWAAATKSDREMQHNRSHPPTNWWIQDGGWSLALEEHSSKWSCPLIDCTSVREWERKPSILHWNLNRVWQSQGNNSIGKWFANRMFFVSLCLLTVIWSTIPIWSSWTEIILIKSPQLSRWTFSVEQQHARLMTE